MTNSINNVPAIWDMDPLMMDEQIRYFLKEDIAYYDLTATLIIEVHKRRPSQGGRNLSFPLYFGLELWRARKSGRHTSTSTLSILATISYSYYRINDDDLLAVLSNRGNRHKILRF